MVPDIPTFVNLWLCLATFAAWQPNYAKMQNMNQKFKLIEGDLVKLFNQNPRWNATELNLSEASNVSVAIAVLKVTKDKFIGDIGDIIRMNIKETTPNDLPNLAKSSFYMRDFKFSKDLYS
jgi:hypothetical protein